MVWAQSALSSAHQVWRGDGTPLGTADATTLQLVHGSDDHQSFPDFDWLRIATRKSLQPIARQCLDAAAKFLEQRRRIAPRAAYNFQFQTLTPGSAYDHKLAVSVRLKKVFVRFKPMYFGCSAPQIHREDLLGGPPSPRLRRARSRKVERVTRLELATSTLARWCSTN